MPISNFGELKTPSIQDLGLNESFRSRYDAALAANNPDSIDDTGWDHFANMFGFRSSSDKLRLQIQQRRLDALQQLVNQQAEQDYNSEASKAARMRGAGLNSDLLGLDSASEATEGIEPETMPDFNSLPSSSELVRGIGSALSSAMEIFSGFQSLMNNGVDIRSKLLDYSQKINGRAFSIIQETLPKADFFRFLTSKDNGIEWSDDQLFSLGLRSPRERAQFRSYASNLSGSYAGQLQNVKSLSDLVGSENQLAESSGTWYRDFGSETPLSFMSDSIHSLNLYLLNTTRFQNKMLQDYYKKFSGSKKAAAENEQNAYQREYFQELNGDQAARALNSENAYKTEYYGSLDGQKKAYLENASSEFEKYMIDERKKLIERLLSKSDPFSTILANQILSQQDLFGNLPDAANGMLYTGWLGTNLIDSLGSRRRNRSALAALEETPGFAVGGGSR